VATDVDVARDAQTKSAGARPELAAGCAKVVYSDVMEPPRAVTSLVDLLETSAAQFGPRELFGVKTGTTWVYRTYAEVAQLVEHLRGGLASLGVTRGDRVGIIANNRLEWAVAAFATYGLGAAFVPMYESQLDRDWDFIVGDASIKVLFVANEAVFARTKDMPQRLRSLEHVVPIDPLPAPVTYRSLLEKGTQSPVPAAHPQSGDTACLLYTSGTTGNPKGVVLSHGNLVSNVFAVHANLPMTGADRSLAFLPWAHAFGQNCELNIMISIGASMAICESTDKIVEYLAEVKPTVIFTVPRIFNRIYAGVQKQMLSKPKPIRALFHAGLRAANKKSRGAALGLGERLVLALADKLVFAKVRARFGGRMKYAISGAAALAHEIADFVDGLGITVYEGYGLTETSPIVSVNVPGARRTTSVGRAIPGVRVVIDLAATGDAKNGEIVVYGPNVMQGYYNRPDDTKAVFTDDGGFRTGDMGHLDDGYLFITGRIKEQYKLENGKYVVPGPIEDTLKLSPFVANVMVYGDNKPFNVAVIVPNFETVRAWAERHGITTTKEAELIVNAKVRQKIQDELERVSGEFKGYERVRKFELVAEDFTQENGMMTPKLSLKRRVVMDKWGKALEQLYR